MGARHFIRASLGELRKAPATHQRQFVSLFQPAASLSQA